MKIQIKITKEVLEKTKMCSKSQIGKHCAIAYAVREIFPNATVDCGVLAFNFPENIAPWYVGDYPHIKLSKKVWDWVERFDEKTPEMRTKMRGISFEIDVPVEVIDQIGIGDVYKILSESKTLELIAP